MIDLSLSQVEADEQYEELICKIHKRKIISFCIESDCHQSDRFACSQCYVRSEIHSNHKSVDKKDILSLLKGGLNKFKSNLTSTFDSLNTFVITQISQNLKRFVYAKAEKIAQNFESCFIENISLYNSKVSQQLLELYQFSSKMKGNYIQEVCEGKFEKIKKNFIQEIDVLKKQLNDREFQWELQRFDIESQLIHNLSQDVLQAYQRYKNEDIFDNLDMENSFDTKLYLVNDRDFYTVSQFNKEGQRHGRTIEIPQHNHYFKGYIDHGRRHGKGLYIYEDGSVYIGMYRNNQKEGKGQLLKSDGYIYTGDWKNDKKNGAGEERFKDDWIFEGFFDNNLRSGPGQETNKLQGEVVQAIYEEGQIITLISYVNDDPVENQYKPQYN